MISSLLESCGLRTLGESRGRVGVDVDACVGGETLDLHSYLSPDLVVLKDMGFWVNHNSWI